MERFRALGLGGLRLSRKIRSGPKQPRFGLGLGLYVADRSVGFHPWD